MSNSPSIYPVLTSIFTDFIIFTHSLLNYTNNCVLLTNDIKQEPIQAQKKTTSNLLSLCNWTCNKEQLFHDVSTKILYIGSFFLFSTHSIQKAMTYTTFSTLATGNIANVKSSHFRSMWWRGRKLLKYPSEMTIFTLQNL